MNTQVFYINNYVGEMAPASEGEIYSIDNHLHTNDLEQILKMRGSVLTVFNGIELSEPAFVNLIYDRDRLVGRYHDKDYSIMAGRSITATESEAEIEPDRLYLVLADAA